MYELIDNGAYIQLFGNAFLPELITARPVVVDGDLVVPGRLSAPEITVAHGSLIAPEIECPTLHAEILGVFDLSKLYIPPPNWTYTWLRPVLTMPAESATASEASIESVVRVFLQPAMVSDPAPIAMLMDRVRARPACLRARVLFAVALEELMAHPSALTPLGRQVAECFLRQPRLPDHWRF